MMTDLLPHETVASRNRLAYQLREDGLPYAVIAEEFVTDTATVKAWIDTHIAACDDAAAAAQHNLF